MQSHLSSIPRCGHCRLLSKSQFHQSKHRSRARFVDMMSRQFCRRVNERSSRYMATLVATEEFALTPPVRAHMRQAAVITESTVKNGIRIISKDTGAPVRVKL